MLNREKLITIKEYNAAVSKIVGTSRLNSAFARSLSVMLFGTKRPLEKKISLEDYNLILQRILNDQKAKEKEEGFDLTVYATNLKNQLFAMQLKKELFEIKE